MRYWYTQYNTPAQFLESDLFTIETVLLPLRRIYRKHVHVCVLHVKSCYVQRIASAQQYKQCLLAVILFLPNSVIRAQVHGALVMIKCNHGPVHHGPVPCMGSMVQCGHQVGVKLIAFYQRTWMISHEILWAWHTKLSYCMKISFGWSINWLAHLVVRVE